MSEFSDSYHLRSNSIDDGVALLHRAGLRGYVFPATAGWVTVLPEGMPFAPNQELIGKNTGTLLHFLNAEDHGWGFELYKQSNPVAVYSCGWDEEVHVEAQPDIQALENELGPVITPLGPDSIRKVFEPASMEEVFETGPASKFASAVGLAHFEWLSYEYLSKDGGAPGAILVEKQ